MASPAKIGRGKPWRPRSIERCHLPAHHRGPGSVVKVTHDRGGQTEIGDAHGFITGSSARVFCNARARAIPGAAASAFSTALRDFSWS